MPLEDPPCAASAASASPSCLLPAIQTGRPGAHCSRNARPAAIDAAGISMSNLTLPVAPRRLRGADGLEALGVRGGLRADQDAVRQRLLEERRDQSITIDRAGRDACAREDERDAPSAEPWSASRHLRLEDDRHCAAAAGPGTGAPNRQVVRQSNVPPTRRRNCAPVVRRCVTVRRRPEPPEIPAATTGSAEPPPAPRRPRPRGSTEARHRLRLHQPEPLAQSAAILGHPKRLPASIATVTGANRDGQHEQQSHQGVLHAAAGCCHAGIVEATGRAGRW